MAFTRPSINVYNKAHHNQKYRLQVGKFLKSFGARHIFCFNGDPRKKISNMVHTSNISEAVRRNVNSSVGQSDSYFYVNGVRKQNEVKTFRSCFVDLDAGRKEDGSYHEARTVLSRKEKMLDAINKFPVKPSWVVDTRNGYQVYWILDTSSRRSLSASNWNGLQKKLVNYFKEFGADARGIKANQIYRVPYTWWFKVWERKAPYFTSILPGSTGKPVNSSVLLSALDGQSTVVHFDKKTTSDYWFEKHRNRPASERDGYRDHSTGVLPGYSFNSPAPATKTFCNNPTANFTVGDDKTVLLKKTIDFLNQASTALHFSGNKFLSTSAKELAYQIGDKFCVG